MRQYIWVLACAILISGCATKSHEWQRHTEDEFPTRVNWIISQLGYVLDAKRGLQYGTWKVASGEGGPYATYQCPQDGICEIKISNLQCKQSTGGPASCELLLYKNAICELVVPEKKETLEIGCPITVALKPKGKGETASPEEAAAAATAKRAQETTVAAPTAPKGAQEAAAITPAAEEKGEQAKGQSVAGDFVFGLRGGLVVPTQQILKNLSSGTSVGPLVNLEAYYVLREWVRLGMMFEWHQYDIRSGNAQLGTLSTFSLLPTVEFRPTRHMMRAVGFEWVIPYASLGTGVNVHSFSNATLLGNEPVSFPSTFAFRVAGGLDFPITSYLAVNGEVAWKKDSGNFERSGVGNNFTASPLMFLLGLRVHF